MSMNGQVLWLRVFRYGLSGAFFVTVVLVLWSGTARAQTPILGAAHCPEIPDGYAKMVTVLTEVDKYSSSTPDDRDHREKLLYAILWDSVAWMDCAMKNSAHAAAIDAWRQYYSDLDDLAGSYQSLPRSFVCRNEYNTQLGAHIAYIYAELHRHAAWSQSFPDLDHVISLLTSAGGNIGMHLPHWEDGQDVLDTYRDKWAGLQAIAVAEDKCLASVSK